MVCKEDLCSWFQNLSPHKRIDYLCGMLHICLPLELRFVGSYVEDMAKKDSVHLREHECKANSREELTKFNEIDAKSFRTKMAIYLALLRSSNRTCSSIIYQLLENNIKQTLNVMDNMDEMTVHNILLVLSMAMNHPAFSYHQKMKMYEYYNTANEAANELLSKTQVHREAELLIPSLILSESCDMRVCDERVSPAISPQVSLHPTQHGQTETPKVYVTQIEMKGYRQREFDKRTVEYKLQVTWSNGEKKEVFKTNQDIIDFQHKLKEKFPDEPSIHQQAAVILEIAGQHNNRSEVTESVTLYTKSLSDLPPHILQCYIFTSFFDPTHLQPVQMTDASTSPRPQVGLDLPMVHNNPNGDVNSLSPHSPTNLQLGYNGPAHSPSCSTKTTSPLISSPSCQSPVSSIDSPSNSHPSSPSLHDPEPSSFVSHLQSQDLSMYIDILEGYSIQQLQEMRCEEIESLGLPKEAVVTLKASLEEKNRANKSKAPPNGLVDPKTTGLMYPPPPHTFLPPPSIQNSFQFPHPIHPPFYPANMYGFPHYPHPVVTGLQEMSPTNSEYSSPSQSPHLLGVGNKPPVNIPVTDSSSDDSDRDKQPSQAKQSNNSKGHQDTAQQNQPEVVKEEVGRRGSFSTSGTPPLNSDPKPQSAKTGYHGNSGYTSDPTYNAPRPQLMRPPYSKAIPAHINFGVPPKYIINMPENHFKGGPMAIPQHIRDINMTTANLHGYSVFAPDQGPRPMYSMINGHPHAILNRSHMNYVPKSVIQSGLLAQSPAQPGSPTNVSCNNNAGKLHPGNSGPVLPIPPPVTLASAVQHTNSVENINASVPCGHSQSHINNDTTSTIRTSVIPKSSTPTSTPVTQPVPGQSLSNSHCVQMSRVSCTSCGCPGHSAAAPTPSMNYMPQMPQNIWPGFPNQLIPIQAMYMPHAQYVNGINQEQVYNHHGYGLVNQGNPRVSGNVPNFVYGVNCQNSNHAPSNSSNSGYSKRVKKIFCSNCGSNKHMAVDCTETTMEAMSGHVRYSYKNDSD